MKKYFLSFICFFFFFFSSVYALSFDLSSNNVILYNLDENKILYEKNSDSEIAIASLTKIMTAIVSIEKMEDLNTTVTITASDLKGLEENNLVTAGFYVGQKVTYLDLLYGLLLPSGADAAQTLTRVVSRDKESFVNLMNEKAKELNLLNTHFKNETGLDEEGSYSTLKDVGTMFQYALQNETLKKIMTSESYTISDESFTVSSTVFKNIKKNNLTMNYILGGKTGTTDNAGLCLASIAEENNTNYMLITARAPYDKKTPYNFLDAKKIYDYFIANYERKKIVEENDEILILKTKYAKEDEIKFYANEPIEKYVEKTFQKEELTIKYDGLETIPVTTKVGTKLGHVTIEYQDELLKSFEIVLTTKLHFDLVKYLSDHVLMITILFIFLIFLLFILKLKKRKRKIHVKKSRNSNIMI